jgi:hypothetical protein
MMGLMRLSKLDRELTREVNPHIGSSRSHFQLDYERELIESGEFIWDIPNERKGIIIGFVTLLARQHTTTMAIGTRR